MYQIETNKDSEKNYQAMVNMVKGMLNDDSDVTAVLSNLSAVINEHMDGINWVGFYLMKEGELVLAPFQGKPACIRLQVGKGVCGTAVAKRKTQLVEDVSKFPGHVACDSATNSEIVIPIFNDGDIFGVLDVDSPEFNRFGEIENKYLSEICMLIEQHLDWDEAKATARFVSLSADSDGCFSCGQ